MRLLVLIHRYLGIVIGVLMAGWCLSGVVMMYVGYPQLSHSERLHALAPLDLRNCCGSAESAIADDTRLTSFQLEMMASRPVLRLQSTDGTQQILDLQDGHAIPRVRPEQALATAQIYGSSMDASAGRAGSPTRNASSVGAPIPQLIDYDQWTVAGVSGRERPLYRIALGDSAGTLLYVSSTSGRIVQTVTAHERFWNWLGAVPHWLYFAELRRHVRLWSQVVIWTSLLGCFLTITGIYLGIQRFTHRPRDRWSPFRGLLLWHHLPGLIFGIFALSWVASGLVSMNPWGFLESHGVQSVGTDFSGLQLKDSLRTLTATALTATALPAGVVSIESAPMSGQLYLIASGASGSRIRLDDRGAAAPLTRIDVAQFLKTLGAAAAPEMIISEDAYYFSHHREKALLPAYRAILADEQKTRLYIDPISGLVLSTVDSNSRWYRWLHEGLHRMDFTPTLRTRPVWDGVMLLLMCAVATVCCTGAVLGIRRLVGLSR